MKKVFLGVLTLLISVNNFGCTVRSLDTDNISSNASIISVEVYRHSLVRKTLMVIPIVALTGLGIFLVKDHFFAKGEPELKIGDLKTKIDELENQNADLQNRVTALEPKKAETSETIEEQETSAESPKVGFFKSCGKFFVKKASAVKGFILGGGSFIATNVAKQLVFGGAVSSFSNKFASLLSERDIYYFANKKSMALILEQLKQEAALVNPSSSALKLEVVKSLQAFASNLDASDVDQISLENFSNNLKDSITLISDATSVLSESEVNTHLSLLEVLSNKAVICSEYLIGYMTYKIDKISNSDDKVHAKKLIENLKEATNNFAVSMQNELNSENHEVLSKVIAFSMLFKQTVAQFSSIE